MSAQETHDEILVRVIMDPAREYVITSYPLNADRNPCPKDDEKKAAVSENNTEEVVNSAEGTKIYNLLNSISTKAKKKTNYNN